MLFNVLLAIIVFGDLLPEDARAGLRLGVARAGLRLGVARAGLRLGVARAGLRLGLGLAVVRVGLRFFLLRGRGMSPPVTTPAVVRTALANLLAFVSRPCLNILRSSSCSLIIC